ncbi:MAG TPA: exodeoxyribonuclease VII small subunit [Chloroflexia bacterium]|nr:exodeoxyribonuclease VII small subunit [Chloroflexia bacterium]
MAQSNNKAAHADKGASFEQSFMRLQEVVQKLSDGQLTLQDALASFEEGMSLADRCAQMLDEAELRVKQVSEGAVRSGSSGLAELDQAMRNSPLADEPELVTFEVESYESAVVIAAPTRGQGSGVRGQGSDTEETGSAPEKSKIKNQGAPRATKIENYLDPLFDEDD